MYQMGELTELIMMVSKLKTKSTLGTSNFYIRELYNEKQSDMSGVIN